jgi:DNA polymerase I-like protein with 3'-5' exonuclease and polymerase domains
LNYLVQSTSTDLVFEQVCKIHNLLKNKKSYISFLVHDSVVIDLAKEDRSIVNELVNVFSDTLLGTFPVNISIGKHYGSLRKI